ncbi:MAG: hypothetical protein WBW33_12440 [Bryobacteraceae bacterium]
MGKGLCGKPHKRSGHYGVVSRGDAGQGMFGRQRGRADAPGDDSLVCD